jgi:threonine-phosphate decarboxylase
MNATRAFPHGGLVDAAARQLGVPPEEILDFSANLNPAGLPQRAAARLAKEAADPRLVARYPDPEARELKLALAARLDLPPETIVIGAGADALIHAAIRTLAPRACIIPVPAFAEYERACAGAGIAVRRIALNPNDGFRLQPHAWRGLATGETIVFNNPHNPTGACAARFEMLDRIASARSNGATVLVDEAFVDYTPEAAITRDAAAQSGVVAIRSLTKFYGCAGLRVGYAVASPETALTLQGYLPPWPVTTLAANTLAEAIADGEYARTTIACNADRRTHLAAGLASLGCRVFPGSANFLLFELPAERDAADLQQRLLETSSILVRLCDSFDGLTPGRYIRVAVRCAEDNSRLVNAFAETLKTLLQETLPARSLPPQIGQQERRRSVSL